MVGVPSPFVARAQTAENEAGLLDVAGDALVGGRPMALLVSKDFRDSVLKRLSDQLVGFALPEQVVSGAADSAGGAEIVLDDVSSHEPVRRSDTARNNGLERVHVEAVAIVNHKRVILF